ncbi:hypothetical protein [uncultured Methanobrevibacter sp.]|uniref:hypothetical protein n=1 Tax=uncultured Methanobrevibacter sp. TaxID=253161 RepID=UPI002622617D|nr:hypothetical protein [uncultured Methanobrevibacter sp.]
MNDYNGKILQIINEGIKIEDLLNSNLITEIGNEFKDKKITPIKLLFIVEEEQKAARLITLIHKNHLQTNNRQLIIDVEDPEDLDLIVNCVNNLRKAEG